MFSRAGARPGGIVRCLRLSPSPLPQRPSWTTAPQRLLSSTPARRRQFISDRTRDLFKQNPFSFTLAMAIIVVSGSIFLYTNYVYKSYIIDGFSRYPEPVAVKLRRALYFTNVSLDAKQALKYYRLALEKAEEAQMHPFSDEVLGIRIQVAALLEKCSAHAQSAQVLEAIRQDCLSWIEERGGGIDGLKEPLSLPPSPLPPPPPPPLASTSSSSTPSPIPSQTVSLVAPPDPVQLRTKLLKRAVAISVKLGDLYADAFIGDRDAAEEHLVWAVETTLRERERRRRRQHQAPDEPPSRTARGAARKTLIRMPASEGPVAVADGDEWMSDDEIGASMESLAHHYEERGSFYLATPLFLQALSLAPTPSCHAAVLMNNIAVSLAQQPPADESAYPTRLPSTPAPARGLLTAALQTVSGSRATPARAGAGAGPGYAPPLSAGRVQLVRQAQTWAEQARAHARDAVPAHQRSDECGLACAVATTNLAEFAELLGDVALARARYAEARSLAKALGSADTLARADSGLARVKMS